MKTLADGPDPDLGAPPGDVLHGVDPDDPEARERRRRALRDDPLLNYIDRRTPSSSSPDTTDE